MALGTVTLDFGATPTDAATLLVTTSGLTAASYIDAYFQKEATGQNTADDHEMARALCSVACEYVSATQFRVLVNTLGGMLAQGQFTLRWVTA